MTEIKVRYGQTVKVTNPSDRYENSSFSISTEVSVPFEDPPEDPKEYEVWDEARTNEINAQTEGLRLICEAQIQKDIDQFIADNTAGE